MDEVENGLTWVSYAQAGGGEGVSGNGISVVLAVLIAFVAVLAYKVLF